MWGKKICKRNKGHCSSLAFFVLFFFLSRFLCFVNGSSFFHFSHSFLLSLSHTHSLPISFSLFLSLSLSYFSHSHSFSFLDGFSCLGLFYLRGQICSSIFFLCLSSSWLDIFFRGTNVVSGNGASGD